MSAVSFLCSPSPEPLISLVTHYLAMPSFEVKPCSNGASSISMMLCGKQASSHSCCQDSTDKRSETFYNLSTAWFSVNQRNVGVVKTTVMLKYDAQVQVLMFTNASCGSKSIVNT